MALAATVFCGGFSVPAFSQSEAMTADIPFAFYADGKLMPSKKGQKPPDLSYFKQTQ